MSVNSGDIFLVMSKAYQKNFENNQITNVGKTFTKKFLTLCYYAVSMTVPELSLSLP